MPTSTPVPSLRIYVATGHDVIRVDEMPSGWQATPILDDLGAQCVAVDPGDADTALVGTFDNGAWLTANAGASWTRVLADDAPARVLSVAISRTGGAQTLYAGTEPSQVHTSHDGGSSWSDAPSLLDLPSVPGWSFPPRPHTHHVRWIAPHTSDPQTLHVGIELGGVMTTRDGGQTWEDRKPGSQPDAHSVRTHDLLPERVYEAAGGGVAISHDAGRTWQPADDGMELHYAWAVAVDPVDPDLWYVSAARGAREAHGNRGSAGARLYRRRGDAPWQLLPTLPDPLPYMPYALETLAGEGNLLLVGNQNGTIWRSEDAGDTFYHLPLRLRGLLSMAVTRR